MTDFEVPEAIICSPFEEPTHYWRLEEGAEPEKRPGRRPAIYYYPDPASQDSAGAVVPKGTAIELKLVRRAHFEITFPRVEGYRQAIRNRIAVDWAAVPPLFLDPFKIPPEVEVKASLQTNTGRPSLTGPGAIQRVDLNPFRSGRRIQELVFEMAGDLTREYVKSGSCEAPAHVLFPQLVRIVQKYVAEKVTPIKPAERLDLFLSP